MTRPRCLVLRGQLVITSSPKFARELPTEKERNVIRDQA